MITSLTGILLPTVEPGSADWLTRMSASKVAAVMGLSPYESPFSLWHRMAGLVPPQEQTEAMSRGHYLEPAIVAWFADQHPTWKVTPAGTYVSPEDDRFAATPDRLVTTDEGELRLVECKSEGDDESWGEPGSDDIPIHYRCQVLWQMAVTGARVTHLGLLTKFLRFVEYVVPFDATDAAALTTKAAAFMASLPSGSSPQRPALDSHDRTYTTVRQLHPSLSDPDVDVDLPVARRYCDAVTARKAAVVAETAAKTELADLMGDARRALFAGDVIATRKSKNGGLPYVEAARKLPTFPNENEVQAA